MTLYDFVPRIEQITELELRNLRHKPKGSHTDIILKESLLDADYNLDKIREIASKLKNIWMINSFIDLYPCLKACCEGTVLRSEFLFLRYLGDNKYSFSDTDSYLSFLSENIFQALPNKIIYRLCDYNNQDFNFLDERYKSRGAARLIEQNGLLETDLKVIDALQNAGKQVDILVPYIVFPEEFYELKQGIEDTIKNPTIGVMLEVPVNLLEVNKYDGADFFLFGPGDLVKNIYGGIDRNSARFGKVNPRAILPLITYALESLASVSHTKPIYLVKELIGQDFRNFYNIIFVNTYMPSQILERAKIQ